MSFPPGHGLFVLLMLDIIASPFICCPLLIYLFTTREIFISIFSFKLLYDVILAQPFDANIHLKFSNVLAPISKFSFIWRFNFFNLILQFKLIKPDFHQATFFARSFDIGSTFCFGRKRSHSGKSA